MSKLAGIILMVFTIFVFSANIIAVKRSLFFLLITLGLSLSTAAQQRPLITDDVDITPAGAFEIGAGVDFLQNVKFPLSGLKGDLTRVGNIRMRTGLASNVELQIEGTRSEFPGHQFTNKSIADTVEHLRQLDERFRRHYRLREDQAGK